MKRRISRTLLDQIYAAAPVPVYERHMPNFFGKYNGGSKSPHILISKDLPNYQKLAVFYHELGHCLCAQRKCPCQESDVKNEVHAMMFGIRECRKLDFETSYEWSIQSILDINNYPDRYGRTYRLAAKRVARHKEFREYLYDWM